MIDKPLGHFFAYVPQCYMDDSSCKECLVMSVLAPATIQTQTQNLKRLWASNRCRNWYVFKYFRCLKCGNHECALYSRAKFMPKVLGTGCKCWKCTFSFKLMHTVFVYNIHIWLYIILYLLLCQGLLHYRPYLNGTAVAYGKRGLGHRVEFVTSCRLGKVCRESLTWRSWIPNYHQLALG